jgi:hypothetical protein
MKTSQLQDYLDEQRAKSYRKPSTQNELPSYLSLDSIVYPNNFKKTKIIVKTHVPGGDDFVQGEV